MRQGLITALIALIAGFMGAMAWSLSGLSDARTRAALVAHPEVLPEMAAALQRREAAARLAEIGNDVARPFPGAVLGNRRGTRTLVMFTDYACGYCRQSERDVARLIAADPALRVVIREWPIFPGSEAAARMALAAAAEGKYAAFHQAMFAAHPPTPASITRASARAGLNAVRARGVAASAPVSAELERTAQMARILGFTGTPSWVANGQVLEGAVGYDRLKAAIADERGA